jgi:hypothetical protein
VALLSEKGDRRMPRTNNPQDETFRPNLKS